MKKALSVLLAALMLLSIVPFAASAAENLASAPRFIVADGKLEAIDFSAMIESKSTINKGMLKLVNDTLFNDDVLTGSYWSWSKFDPAESGVVYIGIQDDFGFEKDPIELGAYNYTFTLRAESGVLFDDVKTFSFTVKEVYDSLNGEQQIMHLPTPEAVVSNADGNIVKEMMFDFKGAAEFLPNTVDLDKTITLAIRSFGIEFYVTAVPVRYSKGVLTTIMLDENGKEGVPLHNLEIASIDGNSAGYAWNFTFTFPSGILRYNDALSNQTSSFQYVGNSIKNIPIQTAIKVKLPKWMKKLDSRPSMTDRKATFLVTVFLPFLAPFPITRMMIAIRKSLATYGLDSNRDLRTALLGSIREFFGK